MITGAANQGVSMPRITETKGQVPEAGYPGTIAAKPIAPGAVEVAKHQFAKEMEGHFKQRELQTGLKMDAEKKILFEQLDRTDDATATEAKDTLNRFTALGGDPRLLAQIQGYTTPGVGSKMAWNEVKTKIIPEEMKLAAQADYKMRLAREITQRTLDNTALKGRVSQALQNTKMDATQYKNILALHHEIGQRVAQTTKRAEEVLNEATMETDPKKQQLLQNTLNQLRQVSNDLQEQ